MHFVILSQYYPPEIGAQASRLSELAEHAIGRGHKVTVLTAMPNYPLGKIYPGYGGLFHRENRNGVNVIRTFIYPAQSANLTKRLLNYLSFVISSAILGTFLLRKVDYLFVQSPPLFLGLCGLWFSCIKRAPLIFNVSDLWPESGIQINALKPKGMAVRIGRWLERLFYTNAWLISVQSRGILKNIKCRFPDANVYLLSNGVDTKLFHPQKRNENTRKYLAGDAEFVVLYAGLHGLAQGLEQVLDAAETLRFDSKCHFVLVGDGPEKEKLVTRAKMRGQQNIQFRDSCPREKIPEYLSACDAVVVPLKTHILGAVPSKIYEAMACGKPIILVANGEAAEIIRKNNAGIVVEPNDIDGLCQAVQNLRRQENIGELFGNNGRKTSVEYFDRFVINKKFLGYLEGYLHE